MAKGKKKKKDLDFQKVKLKIGRKLKPDSNETRAEFHSRKIILKDLRSNDDDPLAALSRHSENISHNGKLSLLKRFKSAITPDIVNSLDKPLLDKLSKFIVDKSEEVRSLTYKCLRSCFNQTRQQNLSTSEFVLSLKPYLDCAYTHVDKGIVTDCHNFLFDIVSANEPQTFEALMTIILRRYEAGNLTSAEKKLAIKLRQFYTNHKRRETVKELTAKDSIEPIHWSETNFFIDLDHYIYDFNNERLDLGREILLEDIMNGSKIRIENIVDRYLEVVKDNEDEKLKSYSFVSDQPAKKRRFA